MRHRNGGFKLGRNTSHRQALLRNLTTSVILEDRVHTTLTKAKAVRPHVEKMITLGKKGDLHSRRMALAFLRTDDAVKRLFEEVAPRYGDRQGGYLRIVRTGFQKGDGAEKAFIELLGAEKVLEEKQQKRDAVKAKKRAELEKQLEEAKKEEGGEDLLLVFKVGGVALTGDTGGEEGDFADGGEDLGLAGEGLGRFRTEVERGGLGHFIQNALDGGEERQLAGAGALHHPAGDDEAVDLVGAFEDAINPGVAPDSLGGVVLDVAVAAHGGDELVGDELEHLGAVDLEDGALDGVVLDLALHLALGVELVS